MKNSLLITTPYLSNIGGTEIEAVTTAVFLYDAKQYKRISIFTPKNINNNLFKTMVNNRDIHFFNYPKGLESSFITLIDRLFFKLNFQIRFSEFIYWKYKSLFYSSLYVLAYPKSVYFFPILKAFSKQKNRTAKITLWHFKILVKQHLKYYKKFNSIVVFNTKQSDFWKDKYKLNNLFVSDIIIPNEEKLLNVAPVNFDLVDTLKFGYLGRIAKEKNIEAMIKLIAFLNNSKNKKVTLLIQGVGEEEYIKSLVDLAASLNVLKNISFSQNVILPTQIHTFYKQIHVFLVTSLHEGGPITALEAAAAGRMLLSYNVGAMQDRFSTIPCVVNNSFEALCDSAMNFINLDYQEKNDIIFKLKELYESKLSNANKGQELSKILRNAFKQ